MTVPALTLPAAQGRSISSRESRPTDWQPRSPHSLCPARCYSRRCGVFRRAPQSLLAKSRVAPDGAEPPGRTSGVRTELPLPHTGCILAQTIDLQTILYTIYEEQPIRPHTKSKRRAKGGGIVAESEKEVLTPESALAEHRRHWLGLPLEKPVEGSPVQIMERLPHFGRQAFAMSSANGEEIGINPYLDMIYRMPTRQGEKAIPIGVVWKNYRLVDHHLVLRTVQQALLNNKIEPDSVQACARWTPNGERAHFSLLLPEEERFTFSAADGDKMRFRIEVFNSVEGSCRFMAVAGWLRFVCSNGLIVGSALLRFRQQHRQQLQIDDLGRLLGDSLESAGNDKEVCRSWLLQRVDGSIGMRWADEDVLKAWGLKAAVRIISMMRTGNDAELAGDTKGKPPSQIATRCLNRVPGLEVPLRTAFGVSQALSWLAGQRSDISEELEWRGQVPELTSLLVGKAPATLTTAR
jgi:hypothetical protein